MREAGYVASGGQLFPYEFLKKKRLYLVHNREEINQ